MSATGRPVWDHCPVTSVGIVGAGRAATLHAEAVRAAAGMELAGVAAQDPGSPRAAALAAALDCPVLKLAELASRCDLVVVATPPPAREEAMDRLAESRRLRAVLVESPVAVTIGGVERLRDAFAPRPVMAGVNLLHAPAVRRLLDAVAAMAPHHLELRLAVPSPGRGPGAGPALGGGVTVDPGAGFWPVLMAALGAEVVSVSAPSLEVRDGLEQKAEVILHACSGRQARADLRWGALVAEASLEAADDAHVARLEIWPQPVLEIDGEPAPAPGPVRTRHLLSEMGFVSQIDRLDRVGRGDAAPWPDLAAGSAALTVASAAALSSRRGGRPVAVSEVPPGASVFAILNDSDYERHDHGGSGNRRWATRGKG